MLIEKYAAELTNHCVEINRKSQVAYVREQRLAECRRKARRDAIRSQISALQSWLKRAKCAYKGLFMTFPKPFFQSHFREIRA